MNNERRGTGMALLLSVVIAIWATTALLAIAVRTLHVVASIALTLAIAAALVVLVFKGLRELSRSEEEER
jgi:hypothetical protein